MIYEITIFKKTVVKLSLFIKVYLLFLCRIILEMR